LENNWLIPKDFCKYKVDGYRCSHDNFDKWERREMQTDYKFYYDETNRANNMLKRIYDTSFWISFALIVPSPFFTGRNREKALRKNLKPKHKLLD